MGGAITAFAGTSFAHAGCALEGRQRGPRKRGIGTGAPARRNSQRAVFLL